MKFEYDNKTDDRECVAYAHVMDGEGDETLSVAVKNGDGFVTSFYYDGTITRQRCYQDNLGDSLRHKFYHGDKLVITF
jgi:hypothetical protein